MIINQTKILITGGAGFIGSNLVDHFLALKMKVVVLDNLSTGFKKNIIQHFENKNFNFIEGDIRSFNDCEKSVEDCDYVLHHAALGSVERSIHDPITTNDVNINGFLNMIKASKDSGVKRFIYAASSSSYGDIDSDEKVEDLIGKPLSNYAVTKYVNELYADVFSSCYSMQCIGLRYFNVFGKRQDSNGAYAAVIPIWIDNLINLNQPVINGSGEISRDFTHIENVIQANENAIFLDKSKDLIGDSFSEIFNVGCGKSTSLNQLFDYLKYFLSSYNNKISNIDVKYGPSRKGDVKYSKASILKAKKILNYDVKYNIKEGLKKTCEYFWNEKNC